MPLCTMLASDISEASGMGRHNHGVCDFRHPAGRYAICQI